MSFRNRYHQSRLQRGIALIESSAIAVLLTALMLLAFGVSDFISKTTTLQRALDKGISLLSENPISVRVSESGDISLFINNLKLQMQIDASAQTSIEELLAQFPDLSRNIQSYRIEAQYQSIEIDPVSGKFMQLGSDIYSLTRGSLKVDPSIEGESLSDSIQEMASVEDRSGKSLVAEPLAQRVFGGKGWNYLPKSVLVGMKIFMTTENVPARFIQGKDSKDTILSDVRVIHMRGGLQ